MSRATVGQSLLRVDGEEKVTGRAVFTHDFRLPGMAYAKVLRSPLAHAHIRRVDGRGAQSVPGVLAVLTRDNLQVAFPFYGQFIKDQPIVAIDKARYAGDIVAAVVAVEEDIAEEALKKIEVDYDELPAATTIEEALAENAPLIHENLRGFKEPSYGRGASHIVHEKSNVGLHFRYQRGDIQEGFAASDHIIEDTFLFPSAQHYPLEPHISVASFEGKSLTVVSSTQMPFPVRQELSQMFGISLSHVRVVVPYVGGGYGGKGGIKTEALAAALSRLSRRPVRLALSADETFLTVCQPGAKLTIKTGVSKDGRFIARRCEVYLNGGAYATSGPSVAEKAGYRAHGPYRIPHVLTDSFHVYTNTVPAGAFRGFGATQVVFAYESHLDSIALRLNMDPLELRIKNILEKGEEFAPGDTRLDCDLKGGLLEVADMIQWQNREDGAANGLKRGKGIACAVKDGGGTNKPAHALVKILSDGSVVLATGSVEIGQGIRTALLQVVAEELAMNPEEMRVAELDTQHTPFDKGTNASSAVSIMGQAVQKAARHAREQFIAAAAQALQADPGDVELKEGKVVCRDRTLSFREVMRSAFADTGTEIVGRGFFKVYPSREVPLGYPSPFWEIGLAGAEVEVDEMTGEVKLLKYASVTDAGKMIHPLHCRGQDEGAAMFGIGLGLCEELVYTEGRLMNPNLVDYRLPRFRDLPRSFTTRILEQGGGPGPYGAKGMGEGGILAAAPAICNAVHDATGMRPHQIPLKGERVWRAVQGAESKKKEV
ncbi:MAG: molybdopterin-dependent oxidoreductase [Deltaproteobacteria bacterium]|nr:molybdopterin-dependent oxidoreductase [Deltaproteobacteria bacterium]